MKAGSRKSPNVERELDKCVKEFELDPVRVNIVSAISLTFVNCYLSTRSEDFISHFSRTVSEILHNAFQCGRLSEVLTETSRRLDSVASSLSKAYHLFDLRLVTTTRLLVDMRNPLLPLEISLAWDPLLNIPFIPSSSLKGRARTYFELQDITVDGMPPSEIFGSQESEGVVLFTDAYPVSCVGRSLVEPDVISPHFSEARYAIDEASASPVPIVFLTVSPNVTFRFLVAVDRVVNPQTSVKIVDEITRALSMGVGAKTTVGYGRLKVERYRSSS